MSAKRAEKYMRDAKRNRSKAQPETRTPEDLYGLKRNPAGKEAALVETKEKAKHPAIVAALAAIARGATATAAAAPALKNIVNPKPATVDEKRGDGAHDLANFPHPISVISGGVPVAVTSDMTSSEIHAIADKKHEKINGIDGIGVTIRARMPVATHLGNAAVGDVSTREFKVNPADPNSFPLIAPSAKIWDCWNANHVRVYARTESGTVLAGNSSSRCVLSVDPEVTDAPPFTKLAAECQTVARAFAAWENAEITIPQSYMRRTKFYYMDDGMVGDADERVTTPCKWYVTIADTVGMQATALTETWVEVEFRFWASTLAQNPTPAGPARFYVGNTATNLGLLNGFASTLDTSNHASVPGAPPTFPGSNPSIALIPDNSTSTTTNAKVRVLLPFQGTPTTQGRAVAGSYVIMAAMTGTFSASTTAQVNFVINSTTGEMVRHIGPVFNGGTSAGLLQPNYTTGAASTCTDMCGFLRVDIAPTGVTFPYSAGGDPFTNRSSPWLNANSVTVGFVTTGSANVITSAEIYVFAVSSQIPSVLSRSVFNDGKNVTTTLTSRVTAFDSAVDYQRKTAVSLPTANNVTVVEAPMATVAPTPVRIDKDEKYVVVPRPPSPTPSILSAASGLSQYFAGTHVGGPPSKFIETARVMLGK
jgi:hypothetical protein